MTLSKNEDILEKGTDPGAKVVGSWVEISIESTPSSANSDA